MDMFALHSFSKSFLSIFYVSGMPVLGSGDTAVNKASNKPCPDALVGERRRQRETVDKINEINGMLSED